MNDKSPLLSKFLKKISLSSAYRTLIIIFFTEVYLDLIMGGLTNTENFYLMYDSANWGTKITAMSASD